MLITLGGFGLGATLRIATIAEAMATGFAMIAVACLLFGLLMPQWGVMQENFPGAWRGVYLEKNAMGSMMTIAAISTLAAAIYVPKRRLIWLGFAGAGGLPGGDVAVEDRPGRPGARPAARWA